MATEPRSYGYDGVFVVGLMRMMVGVVVGVLVSVLMSVRMRGCV